MGEFTNTPGVFERMIGFMTSSSNTPLPSEAAAFLGKLSVEYDSDRLRMYAGRLAEIPDTARAFPLLPETDDLIRIDMGQFHRGWWPNNRPRGRAVEVESFSQPSLDLVPARALNCTPSAAAGHADAAAGEDLDADIPF